MNKKDLNNYNIDCDVFIDMSFTDFKKYILRLEDDANSSNGLLEYNIHKHNKNVYIVNLGTYDNYTRIKINII